MIRPLFSASTIDRYGLYAAIGTYVIQIPADERVDEYLDLVAAAAERTGVGPLPATWRTVDEGGEVSRILMPAKSSRLAAALDPGGAAAIDDSVIVVPSGSLYLLGLLNSRLYAFLVEELSPAGRPIALRAVCAIAIRTLERLPIVTLDLDLPGESAQYSRLVGLVGERITIGVAGCECPVPEAAGIDRQIDAIVYDIYGLSAGERDLVDRSVEGLK
ncbi:MAG: hypothetical protein EHJ95_03015 [Methanobacteriota archaeon]|nr:MAG: hypothetical protein EHJ95_03015 [Euryarchaeota archaeon]